MVLRYHSGKGWIANKVAMAIRSHAMRHYKLGKVKKYVEPFAGMFRVGIEFIKEPGEFHHFTLNDNNNNVYIFWEAIFMHNWIPNAAPLTDEEYLHWKRSSKSRDPLRTFYGHTLSFRGTMFDVNQPNALYNTQRKMTAVCSRIRDLQLLVKEHNINVIVTNRDANAEEYVSSLIYCDPPYFLANNNSWNLHAENEFWTAVYRWLSPKRHNIVYVSAHRKLYTDKNLKKRCIWKQKMPNRSAGVGGYRIEYLYHVQRRTRG